MSNKGSKTLRSKNSSLNSSYNREYHADGFKQVTGLSNLTFSTIEEKDKNWCFVQSERIPSKSQKGEKSELIELVNAFGEPISVNNNPVVVRRCDYCKDFRIQKRKYLNGPKDVFAKKVSIVTIINFYDEFVFSVRAKGKDYEGMLDPGAAEHVKIGESFLEAALRAPFEEYGWKISQGNLLEHLQNYWIQHGEENKVVNQYLAFIPTNQELKPNHEVSSFKTFRVEDVKKHGTKLRGFNMRPDYVKFIETVSFELNDSPSQFAQDKPNPYS